MNGNRQKPKGVQDLTIVRDPKLDHSSNAHFRNHRAFYTREGKCGKDWRRRHVPELVEASGITFSLEMEGTSTKKGTCSTDGIWRWAIHRSTKALEFIQAYLTGQVWVRTPSGYSRDEKQVKACNCQDKDCHPAPMSSRSSTMISKWHSLILQCIPDEKRSSASIESP